MTKTFQLTLSEAQLGVMCAACELLGRVHMGQLTLVSDESYWIPKSDHNSKPEVHEALQTHLRAAENAWKELYGMPNPSNGHPGIHSEKISDRARVAFDLYQVMRHTLWVAQPEAERPKHCVATSPGFRTSTQELLAHCVEIPHAE